MYAKMERIESMTQERMTLAEFKKQGLSAKSSKPKRTAGVPNQTELAYARDILDPKIYSREILQYWFEKYTFTLAFDLRYTPDYAVLLANGELEFHEVKGSYLHKGGIVETTYDDARVKIIMAAEQFPHRFFMCVKQPKDSITKWKISLVRY